MTLTATATAQGALSKWDETIVPALRKRLESESRILTKRMSVASISSADDSQQSHVHSRPLDVPQDHHPEPTKFSAIPRPSLQHFSTTEPRSDASSSYTRLNGAANTPSLPPKRTRTYSQPPSPNSFAHNPLPTPDYSRPTSPRASDVKPTRIPTVTRTRTASTSSYAHIVAHRTNSRNGANHRPHQTPTPDTSQDPWIAKQSEQQPTTPMTSIRHQPSSIINEPPPFSTSLITSSMRSRKQDPLLPDPRPSNDSEERPFEHWYRGDVHRNGGVGELRVAKHMEMLQIANYGHNLRMAIRGPTRDLSGPVEATRGRKRADSVGAGTHESLYLDDEPTKDVGMVFDESPLTDIEGDPDTDPETFYDAYAGVDADADADDTIHSGFSASIHGPPLTMVSTARSETPTRVSLALDGNFSPKQLTQTASGPLQSGMPSTPPRASAESTMRTPQPSALRSRSMSSTTSRPSQSSDQSHPKRRAKSPVTSSPTSPLKKAKPKTKTSPISQDPRNSVAVYPTPEGDMMNAIPTWTQPVQKSGNWDEVVLPVVARKKGLDGLYEQADGSPKPRSPPPVKPAPGTFGYDYTKYRPPRRHEEIPMGDFGIPEDTTIPEENYVTSRPMTPPKPIPRPVQPEEPIRPNPRTAFPNPPNSPAPFSQYRVDRQLPTINVTRPSSEFVNQRRQEQEQDDVTGCCKCIIM